MWSFRDELFTEVIDGFESFVYIIERLNTLECPDSPVYYIGKKSFYSKKKVSGKRTIEESDWWDYYGSSEWLQQDIERFGKKSFKRTILHLCRTKGDAGYLELKEQIERNVLHIDDNYKLYYNKNVLGIYRMEPEMYKFSGSITDYVNRSVVDNKNNKVWVTNGEINRLVTKSVGDKVTNTKQWVFGSCEKHIQVNDGSCNLVVPYSQSDEYFIGWKFSHVVKGDDVKFVSIQELSSYLSNGWVEVDDVIHDSVASLKEMTHMTKEHNSKWIPTDKLLSYLYDGWRISGVFPLYFANNGVNVQTFTSIVEFDDFLKDNVSWTNGRIHQKFSDLDLIVVRNVISGEKELVTPDSFKTNSQLVKLSTPLVKIKNKNRIIFRGYLRNFVLNSDFSERSLQIALRTGNKVRNTDITIIKER